MADGQPPESTREARKQAASAARRADEEARALKRKLSGALKTLSPERSAEERAALAAHPEEAAALRAAMERTAAAKLRKEVNATEVVDGEEELRAKIAQLAALVRGAKHAVAYTGAGMSTAASIPDYRGPQGIWTLHQKGEHNASMAARAGMMGQSFSDATPTAGHMALAGLVRAGHLRHVVSQNVDGLHLRSGVPEAKLCELHGNVFRERCPACGRAYLRGFDVTGRSAFRRHATERHCESGACAKARGGERAALHDTIVHFGEKVGARELEAAREHSAKCDVALFIGSSLKVLQHYKYMWEPAAAGGARKRFVIINLQPTPKDGKADLRIHGRCNEVLRRLMLELGVALPEYAASDDAIRALAPKRAPAGPHAAAAAAAAASSAAASSSATAEAPPEAGSERKRKRGGGSAGRGKRRAPCRAFPREAPTPAAVAEPAASQQRGGAARSQPSLKVEVRREVEEAVADEARAAATPCGPVTRRSPSPRAAGPTAAPRRSPSPRAAAPDAGPSAPARRAPSPRVAANERAGGGAAWRAGDRVQVYWDGERRYFCGAVVWCRGSVCRVHYDDGDEEEESIEDVEAQDEAAAAASSADRCRADGGLKKCKNRCGFWGAPERGGLCTLCFEKREKELAEWGRTA